APTYYLLAEVAGVKPLKPGWKEVEIKPKPCFLKHISAKIPTPLGVLELEYTKTDDEVSLRLSIPPGCKARAALPNSKIEHTIEGGVKAIIKGKMGHEVVEIKPGGEKP
ncbi:MAG: hypothetical protein DRK00_10155, partial [Thermoprotei archaeon]